MGDVSTCRLLASFCQTISLYIRLFMACMLALALALALAVHNGCVGCGGG